MSKVPGLVKTREQRSLSSKTAMNAGGNEPVCLEISLQDREGVCMCLLVYFQAQAQETLSNPLHEGQRGQANKFLRRSMDLCVWQTRCIVEKNEWACGL